MTRGKGETVQLKYTVHVEGTFTLFAESERDAIDTVYGWLTASDTGRGSQLISHDVYAYTADRNPDGLYR